MYLNGISPYPHINVPVAIIKNETKFNLLGYLSYFSIASLRFVEPNPLGLRRKKQFTALASASNPNTATIDPLRWNHVPIESSIGNQQKVRKYDKKGVNNANTEKIVK